MGGRKGVTVLLPLLSLFVSNTAREEAGRAILVIWASLNWSVLRISGGLWGGTARGGADEGQ